MHECATTIVDEVLHATLRELPFWGMSKVRRANALFDRMYGGKTEKRVRSRRVTFSSESPHIHDDVEYSQGDDGTTSSVVVHPADEQLYGPIRERRRPIRFAI